MRPCGGSFETLFRIFEMPCRPGYQILQACSRTIDSPFLQPKALANSAIFESGPLPRNLGSGCGLVLAINRAYSIRSLATQTCVQPRKTEQFEHLRDMLRVGLAKLPSICRLPS